MLSLPEVVDPQTWEEFERRRVNSRNHIETVVARLEALSKRPSTLTLKSVCINWNCFKIPK